MAGFYGFINLTNSFSSPHYERFFSYQNGRTTHKQAEYESLIYGYSFLKNNPHKFSYEDEGVLIVLDATIFDSTFSGAGFANSYRKYGTSAIENLDGNFSGFILDKTINSLFLFTDTLSTKSIYFYHNPEENLFFFGSELKVLTSLLNDLHLHISPDLDGFNSLLSLGYMLDDVTPVKEIRRMDYATIQEFSIPSNQIISTKKYFSLSDIKPQKIELKDAINGVDEILKDVIYNEWNQEEGQSEQQLATLSGGLDSRVNVLFAKELGFNKILCFNCSQSNTPDHQISEDIAKREDLDYTFYPLDTGHYFENSFPELVKANDGMVAINGSAHIYSALKNMELADFPVIHTGQIGDVLFGSFLKQNFGLEENIGKLGFINIPSILKQISNLDEIIERYKNNVELFSYEQRQINGTLNGDRKCSHLVDFVSPFYNRQLISYCLSLPDYLKKNKRLYIEWIRSKHPTFFEYKWDAAGVIPKHRVLTFLGTRTTRLRNAFINRFLKSRNSMNPFELWFHQNKNLDPAIKKIKEENIDLISDEQLKKNVNHVYEFCGTQGKFSAITVILAYKLHFSKTN